MAINEETQLILIKGVLADFDPERVKDVTEAFAVLTERYRRDKFPDNNDDMELILGLVSSKWVIEKSIAEG